MKFWMKVYLLCMILYIVLVNAIGIIMIEENNISAMNKEIKNALKEKNDIQMVYNYDLQKTEAEDTEEYEAAEGQLQERAAQEPSQQSKEDLLEQLANILKWDGSYVEFYDSDKNLIASNHTYTWTFQRNELDKALKREKNYIFRYINDRHYLFVSDMIDNNIILSLIKDITDIDIQRKERYSFFIKIEITGLVLLAVITYILSKYITDPIEKLTVSAGRIASGKYNEKVEVYGKDEIADLASHFNSMTEQISNKIGELSLEADKKQRFINNLIHEMRTPLTSIIGYADFLRGKKYEKEEFFNGLSIIKSEGSRMLDTTNKLMDLMLLKRNALSMKEHDVKGLLEDVVALMKPKLLEKGLKLLVESDELCLPICLQIDYDLIKGVMINLIDNASKGSTEGKNVVLGARTEQGRRIIYVRDEGKGIPKSEIDKITEAFYRVEKSRARSEGGVGLGLAICDEIIKAHNAFMEIHSEEGKGTVIEIIFPEPER